MTDPTHEQPVEPVEPADPAEPAEPANSAGPADLPQPAVPAENGTPAFEAAETPEVPERTRFAEPVTEPVAAAPAEPTISAGPTTAPEPPAPAEIASPVPAREEPAQPETAPMEPAQVELPVEPPAVLSPVAAEPDSEPDSEPEPAASTDTARSGRRLVTALAVVVALLAGLTGFLGYEVSVTSGPGPDQRARQPALQAVRSAAVLLFSYDYRHLQADFTAGRAVTTGKFRGEYDKTTSKLVNDVAPRYKAVVIAAVSEAAVVSAAEDKVVALVFVNQQSSSTLTEAPKVTQSRLLMTVVRRDGAWRVSDISPR